MDIFTAETFLKLNNNDAFWDVKDSELVSPSFGEIWICQVPVLVVLENEITFKTMNRPILVIDDGHGHFIKNDHKNYYGLKITSQEDSYQRMKIKAYYKYGLQKESYLRLEIPLKIEKEQFLYKISCFSYKEMVKIMAKLRQTVINKAI